jgi:hypothetical protein
MPLTLHDKSIPALNDRHRQIIAALVYGIDGRVAEKHGLEPGKALKPQTAADYFKVRRRYVYDLMADPTFKSELMREIATKRLATMPEALDRLTAIMRSDNDPVALRAAEAILGDQVGQARPAIALTVNNTTQVANFRPGYVIRVRGDVPDPAPAVSGPPNTP